jgi:hypothetical protein
MSQVRAVIKMTYESPQIAANCEQKIKREGKTTRSVSSRLAGFPRLAQTPARFD